jgi:metal-dependent amidase/aminoacylase/carboxypeptidase family protein
MDLLAEARQLLPGIIELRRAIHRQPELGLDLPLTQGKVLHALRDLPLDIRTGRDTTSVTADLRGGSDKQLACATLLAESGRTVTLSMRSSTGH